MKQDITITVFPEEENNQALLKTKAADEIRAKTGHPCKPDTITALITQKRSIDARKGKIRIALRLTVWIGEEPKEESVQLTQWKKADSGKTVAIVGSGPAALFASLSLLERGIRPILIERGESAQERKKTIALLARGEELNPESNYCFGEGGAGAFSDGKLYTRSNKRGDTGKILSIFHHHGADSSILTDAHPHIGTDKLPAVITAIRETICAFGGEFRFGSRCIEILEKDGKACGVRVIEGGEERTIHADAVLLATGHSANDIYEMLAMRVPCSLEQKTFAVGVRVEHPRDYIDKIQYHGQGKGLPAAEYRLVTQAGDRGVYSFCMCPGGFIVPASTSREEIVVNGMSSSGRNSRWSNAAIVVEVRPEDIPDSDGSVLAGLRFRTALEREAARQGSGQKAPAQRLADFMAGRASKSLPESSYTPGLVPSRMDQWLPPFISERLREAFESFNRNMKGFICDEAVLVGCETRTSSPVRIARDSQTLECKGFPLLFPAGEGSGYAGGIVSSAMDGEKCAAAIAAKFGL